MKALVLEKADGPESVLLKDIEKPVPREDEVRVAVKAASLNHRELWILQGQYPGMSLPTILGCDCAGVIDAVGAGAAGQKIGEEVIVYPGLNWGSDRRAPGAEFGLLGMPGPGTIAEYVCVPAASARPKPKHLTFEEAAALPLTGLTAWRALFFKGEARTGETVLIIGIGGGVATFALKFAVAIGARVFVTARRNETLEAAKAMGALGGLLYTDADWRKKVMPLTGGIDVAIDGAPGASFSNYVRSMKPGGRAVIYGSTAGNQFQVNATDIFLRSGSIVGSQVGDLQDFTEMLAFVEEKSIKPVIERVFPLVSAKEAFSFLRDDHCFGKVVVSI